MAVSCPLTLGSGWMANDEELVKRMFETSFAYP